MLRPVLKIAYELTVGWLGPAYLNDPQALSVRQCIKTGNLYDIDLEIHYFPERSMFETAALPTTDHAGALVLGDGSIRCAIRIFNVIEAQVLVSEHAGRYPRVAETFLAFDSLTRTVRGQLPDPATYPHAQVEWKRVQERPDVFTVRTFLEGRMTYETAVELVSPRPQR